MARGQGWTQTTNNRSKEYDHCASGKGLPEIITAGKNC